jgi:hypothetical protein
VLAAESRAGQYKHFDIEKAAAHLHGMIDALKGSKAPISIGDRKRPKAAVPVECRAVERHDPETLLVGPIFFPFWKLGREAADLSLGELFMRANAPQTSASLLPAPGTREAAELGCTCRLIEHESGIAEREPAGMLMDPNLNCPLHGSTIQPRSSD